jgi:hypothetical protein
MEAMEEDDPVLYRSLINYIMADESTDLCSDSVRWSDLPGPLMEMAVGADEELDDEADDFELLSGHAALSTTCFWNMMNMMIGETRQLFYKKI